MPIRGKAKHERGRPWHRRHGIASPLLQAVGWHECEVASTAHDTPSHTPRHTAQCHCPASQGLMLLLLFNALLSVLIVEHYVSHGLMTFLPVYNMTSVQVLSLWVSDESCCRDQFISSWYTAKHSWCIASIVQKPVCTWPTAILNTLSFSCMSCQLSTQRVISEAYECLHLHVRPFKMKPTPSCEGKDIHVCPFQ